MNIFVLSQDPVEAARYQCNKHVVKMVTETGQLLSTCFPAGTLRFQYTHVNHPCAKWARQSLMNYKWLVVHGAALADEYTRRYGRIHGAADVIDACLDLTPDIPDIGLTPFARSIKQPWKDESAHMDIVSAYRYYYVDDKARFARWAPRAEVPAWWPYPENIQSR